jgi:biopolymer transport protein ExbB/TolQ
VILAAASPFYAFEQSDAFGRIIVLVLCLLSVLAWSIMVEKWLYLSGLRRQVRQFLKFHASTNSPVELFVDLESQHGPLRTVSDAALQVMAAVQCRSVSDLLSGLQEGDSAADALNSGEVDQIRAAVDAAVDDQIQNMETRLPILGSIVSVSPFLGLLGTVWGVMMAFVGMAAKGKADINAIAPGVSGALLTTVVGLLVAIPSLVGFNMLNGLINQLTTRMDRYSDELVASIRAHYQRED